MASPSFYRENESRAFPFVTGTVAATDGGPPSVKNSPKALVADAGFVLGPRSRFTAGTHSVYLASVRRSGTRFYFEFACDAPGLYGSSVVFTRDLSDARYATEFSDSGTSGLSASSDSLSGNEGVGHCDEPLFSGYLVTGDAAALAAFLPADGVATREPGAGLVEPALVQDLSAALVTRLGVANADRTRAGAPDGCDGPSLPATSDVLFVADRCVRGDVVIRPGYNAVVRQNARDNSVTLGAVVGAGAGEPCGEVPLVPGEAPPAGRTTLDGAAACNRVLRSVSGAGGRQFAIEAGAGVSVTPYPGEHRVVVSVDMNRLRTCFESSARSESC